jgi:DNA-binding CsgD family transcriptional regulator
MITPAIPPEGLFEFRPDFQLSRWKLTKRETEVVEGILLGLSNNEIAAELGISLQTLKGHLQAIGDKMGIDSKRYALRTRIVYLIALRAGKMPRQCELFRIGAGRKGSPPLEAMLLFRSFPAYHLLEQGRGEGLILGPAFARQPLLCHLT